MVIAYGRFAKDDGMVVDIRKYKHSSNVFFDCTFWSDFTDENERLYIACTGNFYIKSIHNVSTNEDYEPFIRCISIFQKMINGYPYNFGAVTSSDVWNLSGLMDDDSKNDLVVPDYMNRFFNNFCNQVQEIKINTLMLNFHDEYADQDVYGFLKLKELFWSKNMNTIELIKFVKLFRNTINTMSIIHMYSPSVGFESSIELNEGFEIELKKLMAFINSSSAIKNRFKYLIIVNPKIDDLDAFIVEKKDYYITKYGWMMEKRQYHDIKKNSKCNDTIYFFPIVT